MNKRQQPILLIAVIILSMTVLAGCAPEAMPPLDPENAGIWDRYFVIPLSDLLDVFNQILGNFGWSILIVTFFVRLLIFPIALKQQRSMEVMRKLKPQMDKIREKHKKDPQKAQEETLKFLQKNNYNPTAGCLPMLIQIPIIFALFQAIMRNSHIADASFLYLKLGSPDPYYVLPILAALTTFIQILVTGTGGAEMPQMNLMLIFFPIMIFVISLNFPSALVLYWFYGNIFTILQYLLFFKRKGVKVSQEGAAR